MAYSELVKNFEHIRDYMRQFYIFGFKSRAEYDKKSARSYDNERRRIESWLGDFIRFRQTADGKHVFLSVDSRAMPSNPLYQAFKAKSFTAGDVTFHFYILDLLHDEEAYTVREILELFYAQYLNQFESDWQPDISTIRKKLKEYVSLGLLRTTQSGRTLYYSRAKDAVALDAWADAVAFFSEVNPLGVIGSTILDKRAPSPKPYQFKHHYILHALDSEVLLRLLMAIGSRMTVSLTNVGAQRGVEQMVHTVCPLKIAISTQSGLQYLLCYHYRLQRLAFFRLDCIHKVEAIAVENAYDTYMALWESARPTLWGVSLGDEPTLAHLEMTIHFDDKEQHIPRRLEREKRNGHVEMIDRNTCKYIVDTYDVSELLPWLRTFTGRIESLECSDATVVQRFDDDVEQTLALYGGEA